MHVAITQRFQKQTRPLLVKINLVMLKYKMTSKLLKMCKSNEYKIVKDTEHLDNCAPLKFIE